MSPLTGGQRLATILKHDTKTTSYKIALLRAINDVVLLYPTIQGQDVAVPLKRLAELWVAYYWPFADAQAPIYQGGRAGRGEADGVWTLKRLTQPQDYDLDHLLPLAVYPVNELWNLLPVDRAFNQHIKRDRVPDSGRLTAAEPWLATAYATYLQAPSLQRAVREDAALRFTGLGEEADFAPNLASRAVRFIDAVAAARYVQRF